MAKALLKEIGYAAWMKGDAMLTTARAEGFLADLGTWIVAIDNLQDVPERRKIKGVLEVGNWIRDLIERSRCLVVLLGTPAAREIVRANPQLRRRTPVTLNMGYFSVDTPQEFSRFKRFLHEVDGLLPFAEPSRLEGLARKIYWATYGIQDYLFWLLAFAVESAVEAGREHIQESDLATAFEMLFEDAARSLNPFIQGGPERLLDRPGEPFEDWFSKSNPMPGSAAEDGE